MTDENTPVASLEERLRIIEKEENQGRGFSGTSWVLLLLTGVVGPALILLWGAS
ncbi:MAG: hypothetical protein V2I43_20935 [Parvularcula sp.]|jgi:hypothetical protein|nr:hypothetical protein [Parvularcula sp.]